jgi:hypothetical protein
VQGYRSLGPQAREFLQTRPPAMGMESYGPPDGTELIDPLSGQPLHSGSPVLSNANQLPPPILYRPSGPRSYGPRPPAAAQRVNPLMYPPRGSNPLLGTRLTMGYGIPPPRAGPIPRAIPRAQYPGVPRVIPNNAGLYRPPQGARPILQYPRAMSSYAPRHPGGYLGMGGMGGMIRGLPPRGGPAMGTGRPPPALDASSATGMSEIEPLLPLRPSLTLPTQTLALHVSFPPLLRPPLHPSKGVALLPDLCSLAQAVIRCNAPRPRQYSQGYIIHIYTIRYYSH